MILSGIVSIDYRCVHAKSDGRRSKGQGHRGQNIANLGPIWPNFRKNLNSYYSFQPIQTKPGTKLEPIKGQKLLEAEF